MTKTACCISSEFTPPGAEKKTAKKKIHRPLFHSTTWHVYARFSDKRSVHLNMYTSCDFLKMI